MATYNGEKFLRKQLESILNQTYDYFELIICDDNSIDNTKNILKEYAKKDNRIKLFFNEKNLGVNKNFEKCIKLAKGDYISIADQDDIWISNKLKILLENIQDNILIYHDDFLIDGSGNIVSDLYFKYSDRKVFSLKSLFLENWISGHSMLFDSKLKNYLFPFPGEKYIRYYDHWIALVAYRYGKVKFLNKSLVYWRQHTNNHSGNRLYKQNININSNIRVLKYKWRLNRIRQYCFLKVLYKDTIYYDYLNELIKYEINDNKLFSLKFFIKKYKNFFPYNGFKANFFIKRIINIFLQNGISYEKIKRIFDC